MKSKIPFSILAGRATRTMLLLHKSQITQRGEAATNEQITAEYSEYAETRAASVLLPRISRIPRSLLCGKSLQPSSKLGDEISSQLANNLSYCSAKSTEIRNGRPMVSAVF